MKEILTNLGEGKPETMTLEHDDSWMSILIPISQSPTPVFFSAISVGDDRWLFAAEGYCHNAC